MTKSTRQTIFVSFSGIDGAGKSTQIGNLRDRLIEAGFRVRVVAFWDEIVALGKLRETSSHTLFKSEKGIGTPEKPVNRRDKNVRTWYMTPVRFFLYLLDAIQVGRVVRRFRANSDVDVIIFDRYLYDELANLPLDERLSRLYVRLVLKLCPHPLVAYLLDADPVAARQRKPEYPLDFLHTNRATYLALAKLADMSIMPALPASDVAREVVTTLLNRLPDPEREVFAKVPFWIDKVEMNASS
jgi:thymidylate kinase